MSKVALADALGVTTRVLQKYESEGAPASRARELAVALDVRREFFSLSELQSVEEDRGYFRARKRATSYQRRAARATAALGVEMYNWLAARFRLPSVDTPDADRVDPEAAATLIRAQWGQGSGHLPNLVQLCEAHGVRVLSLPADTALVDAFSFWQDDIPYVFLSTAKSPERSRFDLAHELGHLVLHSRTTDGVDVEHEADAFASAFLMPRDDVLARTGRAIAVPEILRLRSHYRVSAMAMTRRLHEIGRLSDWAYRQNCVELSQRGYRASEPDGIRRERSRVFATVFSELRRRGTSIEDVTRDLGILPTMVHDLTFGQVVVPLTGSGTQGRTEHAGLRLVHG